MDPDSNNVAAPAALHIPPCLVPRAPSSQPTPSSRELIAQVTGNVRAATANMSRFRLSWPADALPRRFMIVHKAHGEAELAPFIITLCRWLRLESPSAQAGLQVSVMLHARFCQLFMRHDPALGSALLPFSEEPDNDSSQSVCIDDIDLVLTMGGDGTVLNAAWLFQQTVPPILSFHFGTLGFLTMFNFAEHRDVLSRVIQEGTRVNIRMRLECRLKSSGAQVVHQVMNEVVVDRGPSSFMSSLELFGDGELLTSVLADGIIFATTTGSTAYSMSAGGSMVHPDVPAILVTPICPHSLSFRPFLVPASVELSLRLSPEARSTAWIAFDGRARYQLGLGDSLTIVPSKFPVTTACRKNQTKDWFEGLSQALHWNEKPRPLSTLKEEAFHM
jgi:NAD kinase